MNNPNPRDPRKEPNNPTLSEALRILKAKIQETPRTLSDEEIGAVRVLVKALTWQDIATAPKGGKIIIAFAIVDAETGNWNQHLVSWNKYHTGEDAPGYTKWHGWPRFMTPPTHWMPLPAPPEREAIDAARRSA